MRNRCKLRILIEEIISGEHRVPFTVLDKEMLKLWYQAKILKRMLNLIAFLQKLLSFLIRLRLRVIIFIFSCFFH